jgi:hypothetical protein
VDSDADEQLLVYIPFTGNVKLKSIVLITGEGEVRPTTMKAFKNREDIDFEVAEDLACVQEWELAEAPEGSMDGVEYVALLVKKLILENTTKRYLCGPLIANLIVDIGSIFHSLHCLVSSVSFDIGVEHA